jgi:hypothetical protein
MLSVGNFLPRVFAFIFYFLFFQFSLFPSAYDFFLNGLLLLFYFYSYLLFKS